ncbi:MAG TPA: succinate--CoA ligase subunit alpha [Phycisphaerae bacterium]|nr:succinate--CoA ligase subunit alpha [Phycisphaerae bacterium]
MSVLVNKNTKVITQGITGAGGGAFHTKGCLDYGTKMVGGTSPGKGGTKDPNGLPVFDTVSEAVKATGADASMVFVPPAFCADAIMEAADAGIRVIVAITEGVPVNDMVRVKQFLKGYSAVTLIGPNCPGIITPGECKIGIMPGYIHTPHVLGKKTVGIVSRSGTLTYEAVFQTTSLGWCQSTCIGIGGDPVKGLDFIDVLKLLNDDPDTDALVMIGEIGGTSEVEGARFIKQHVKKPTVGFIAGATAPPGKRMGHAGALISGEDDTAPAKMKIMRECGITVCESPADIGVTLDRIYKK